MFNLNMGGYFYEKKSTLFLFFVTVLSCLGIFSCSKKQESSFPGTPEGARSLVQEFLIKPGADHASLSRRLKPTKADYEAVFIKEIGPKVEQTYEKLWAIGPVISRRPEQTDIKIFAATTEELKAGTGNASFFPDGYRKAAPFFQSNLTFYIFKFVKPGENLGTTFDGLTYANGHWVIFFKPYLAIDGLVFRVQSF